MVDLQLDPQEFQQIVRACHRVLVNPCTSPVDLQRFLMTRLMETSRDTAAHVGALDEQQVQELRLQILTALQANTDSRLWT
jgi:hypothetical protein